MKEYEDRKYEAWKEQVQANLLIYLKKNLLTKPSTGSATTHRSMADEGASSEDASGSLAAAILSQGEACIYSVSKFLLWVSPPVLFFDFLTHTVNSDFLKQKFGSKKLDSWEIRVQITVFNWEGERGNVFWFGLFGG